MFPKLGLTRTVVRRHYALLAPDGHVASAILGWSGCVPKVLLSSAMGARLTQLLVDFERGGKARVAASGEEWFWFVVRGSGALNGEKLAAGGFGYVPAGEGAEFASRAKNTQALVFRKNFEPLEGVEAPEFFTGHERDVAEAPFLGDPHARLKTLLPDTPAMDLAVNIFTYDPGATLPFVETHIMEHGILFLAGAGVYRLGEDWHPVQAGDALWIAPYCPQWFIAAGPEPARYIYYKDVNREPM